MFPKRLSTFVVSVFMSVIGATIVLSFQRFFLFVPFSGQVAWFRELFAFLSQVGWVLLLVVPPLLLRKVDAWSIAKTSALIASATLYPASLLVLKIYFLVSFGDTYAVYLVNFPALFFLEWLLPAFYVTCAVLLRRDAIVELANSRRARIDYESENRASRSFRE